MSASFQLPHSELVRFVFTQVAARHGHEWLGARRSSVASTMAASSDLLAVLEEWRMPLDDRLRRRLQGVSNFSELLERNLLKGVRLDSHMGLWGLLTQSYPLIVRNDIPNPQEMLLCQCRGQRYVTHLSNYEDLERPIGRFKGSFEFLLHDLEHAHKFFGQPSSFRGQVAFFSLLKQILHHFDEWRADPLFCKDLEYLMSDMNSHPVHLFKYLKAIVLTACLRQGGDRVEKLDEWWNRVLENWSAPDPVRAAALRINQPGSEDDKDRQMIYDFFQRRFLPLSLEV